MDFNRSDLQRMLLDSAERFVDDHYHLEHRRSLRENPTGLDQIAWNTFAELGWLGILTPEEAGGLGGSLCDVIVLAGVLGGHCVTEPFISSAVIAPTILASVETVNSNLLEGLATGTALVALADDEPGSRYPYNEIPSVTKLVSSESHYTLTGQKMMVLDAPSATHLIVTAKGPKGLVLVLLPANADGIETTPYALYDGSRASDIKFNQVKVSADNLLADGELAQTILNLALDRARIVGLAQTIGSMEKELEICSAYVKEREQFGQPIGKFQALQHIMADMFVACHQARSILYFALSNLDGNIDSVEREKSISLASLKIGEASQLVSRQAIQLHGGYGVTDEYEVSHHYRRQFVLEKSFGDIHYHTLRLSAL